MTAFLRKPFLICWLFALIQMGLGFIFNPHSVSIQLYETYYYLSTTFLVLAEAELLLIEGLGYWFIHYKGRITNDFLSAGHLFLTIGVFILSLFSLSKSGDLAKSERITVGIATLLLGQIFYIANLVLSFSRK